MRKGQAMIEYVLAFAGLLVVIGIERGVVGVTGMNEVRTEVWVAREYP